MTHDVRGAKQIPSFYERHAVSINAGILAGTVLVGITTASATVALAILFPPFIVLTTTVGGAFLLAEATVAGTSSYALLVAIARNHFKHDAPAQNRGNALIIEDDDEDAIPGALPQLLENGEVQASVNALIDAFRKPRPEGLSDTQLAGHIRAAMTQTDYSEPATPYIFKLPMGPNPSLTYKKTTKSFVDEELYFNGKRSEVETVLDSFMKDVVRGEDYFKFGAYQEKVRTGQPFDGYFEAYQAFLDDHLMSEITKIQKTELYKMAKSESGGFGVRRLDALYDHDYLRNIEGKISKYPEPNASLMRVKFLQCAMFMNQTFMTSEARLTESLLFGSKPEMTRDSGERDVLYDFTSPNFDSVKVSVTYPVRVTGWEGTFPVVKIDSTYSVESFYAGSKVTIETFQNIRFNPLVGLETLRKIENILKNGRVQNV